MDEETDVTISVGVLTFASFNKDFNLIISFV